jgi:hypothetical protein
VTQGSQSLALGLILTAAPQLVECSRLMRYHQRLKMQRIDKKRCRTHFSFIAGKAQDSPA